MERFAISEMVVEGEEGDDDDDDEDDKDDEDEGADVENVKK